MLQIIFLLHRYCKGMKILNFQWCGLGCSYFVKITIFMVGKGTIYNLMFETCSEFNDALQNLEESE